MRLKKEVGRNRVVLVLTPAEMHRKILVNLIKQAAKDYGKILHVTLSNSYDVLKGEFKKRGIPLDKIYFIDARTATSRPEQRPEKNCTFVSSPEALTELKIAISKALETRGPEITLFDSLSTLLSYLSDGAVARWTHDVIAKLRESKSAAVFLCLRRDEERYLVKDITMFVDKVTRLGGDRGGKADNDRR